MCTMTRSYAVRFCFDSCFCSWVSSVCNRTKEPTPPDNGSNSRLFSWLEPGLKRYDSIHFHILEAT